MTGNDLVNGLVELIWQRLKKYAALLVLFIAATYCFHTVVVMCGGVTMFLKIAFFTIKWVGLVLALVWAMITILEEWA